MVRDEQQEFLPFVFEIGTEEIPSDLLTGGMNSLGKIFSAEMADNGLEAKEVRLYSTPRRIALTAVVARRQPDVVKEVTGPPARIAFNAEGRPTRAAEGFARTQGVALEDLRVVQTPKGEYVGATVESIGRDAEAVLPAILDRCIRDIPWRKSMRWGAQEVTFVRPIKWLLAKLGDQVIPVSFGDVDSGSRTRGHRFHAPAPVQVEDPREYARILAGHHVMADPAQRRELIVSSLKDLASSLGGQAVTDETVLEGNTNLTEWPSLTAGHFPKEYLELPREVIVSAMQNHQRYFPLEDADSGELLPCFVAVNNTDVKEPAVVRAGHEKVIRARLSDASFFWWEDQKRPLASRLEDLKKVTFLSRLDQPSLYHKVVRVETIARSLARTLAPEHEEQVGQAALLSKCDLTTLMVGEFPELQGTMGKYYAKVEELDDEVASALEDHYRPRGATDTPPQDPVPLLVGIADRIDTIASCFKAGLIPTGTADPYALRRASLGILRSLASARYHVAISELAGYAAELVGADADCTSEMVDFIMGRLRSSLADDYPSDVVDAVMASGDVDPLDVSRKVEVLAAFKGTIDFKTLLIGVKRAANITRGMADGESVLEESRLEEEGERKLARALEEADQEVRGAMARRDFERGLQLLAALREPIDEFFEAVLVMAEDETVRNNRLGLCRKVADLFNSFADFSIIRT